MAVAGPTAVPRGDTPMGRFVALSRALTARRVPGGRRSLRVEPMPSGEAQQSPQDAFVVLPSREMLAQELAHGDGREIAQALQSLGRELVFEHPPHLMAQPGRRRSDEASLRCVKVVTREPRSEGPFQ